jgi:hypothetical protein
VGEGSDIKGSTVPVGADKNIMLGAGAALLSQIDRRRNTSL